MIMRHREGLTAAVPSCPDWDVSVLAHQGINGALSTGDLVASPALMGRGDPLAVQAREDRLYPGRAMMIAPASIARPTTGVIEASKCCDQLHWSSTSAPLGRAMNGATTTQPAKPPQDQIPEWETARADGAPLEQAHC